MTAMETLIPFLILATLIAVNLPIAYALFLAGFSGLVLAIGLGPAQGALLSVPYAESASFTLSTVPMFILMAEFLTKGTLSALTFTALARWLGPIRGGLGLSVVAGNGVFGAMSGSSVAAAGLLSTVSVPEMRRHGYSERLSLGSVATAGTLAVLIPPSVALIIYGIATEQSIGRLFAAALVPGILTAIGYALLIWVWVTRSPQDAPPTEHVPWRERWLAARAAMPIIPLVVGVLYVLYSGIATPTEAGALGALGALAVSVVFGGLRPSGIYQALVSTALLTAMIMMIIVGATMFSRFLAISGTSRSFVSTVSEAALPPIFVLILILIAYLILGFFMDQIAILLMTLPVTFPVTSELGYDPIWFGIVVVITVEIGLITPPMGLNVLVTHGVAGGELGDAFKGALTFLIVPVTTLVLFIAFPDIILYFEGLIFQQN